ncbi:MAG: MFS transporter [Opitutus sp.]|nr:MFS transporter [Opitutus sp.]MCS6246580.1 MFS transporter [Opitutus sp.]MCS6272736.1 MFS transporter [Opitutus sp.]MCS6276367.1 MFS transporter [Opitutus sp.]MCS6301985.1 MFS transporter [Opitutus sp.]
MAALNSISTKTSALPDGTPQEDRVPMKAKLAYGAAGAVDNWSSQLPSQLATPIFVTGMGLSPAMVSLAMFIFRLYDAIIDPIMGWVSDNTRSRFGRRKPFIVVGAILTGLTFPLLWHAGRDWSHPALLAWLLGTGLLFYTCFTVWAMPYQSMLLEITPDQNERTNVSGYRTFFQTCAGLTIGWAWYLAQLPFFAPVVSGVPDAVGGVRSLSIVVGVLIIVVGLLPAIYVKERFYKAASKQGRVSLKDNFKWTFTNRPFVLIGVFTLLFCVGSMLSSGLGFYLKLYYVAEGNQALAAKLQGVESTLSTILGLLSIPVFNYLCRRYGKKNTLIGAMALVTFGMATKWWMFTPDYPWLSIVNGVLASPAFTGIWMIIPSINGDVVDFDETRTGERREGAFASIFSWIVKASFSAGIGLAGPLVVWCGFEVAQAAAQTAEAFTQMRLVYALLPPGLFVAGLIVLGRYPLTPLRMTQIRAELEERRGRL